MLLHKYTWCRCVIRDSPLIISLYLNQCLQIFHSKNKKFETIGSFEKTGSKAPSIPFSNQQLSL